MSPVAHPYSARRRLDCLYLHFARGGKIAETGNKPGGVKILSRRHSSAESLRLNCLPKLSRWLRAERFHFDASTLATASDSQLPLCRAICNDIGVLSKKTNPQNIPT